MVSPTLRHSSRWTVASLVVLGVAIVLVSRPTRSRAQSTGLVAAYSFNAGSGGTLADVSGNNLTGTIVGATWTVGRYGNALSFNGIGDYVDLGNPAALQLTGNWYPPAHSGQSHQWSIGPGIGVQWGL